MRRRRQVRPAEQGLAHFRHPSETRHDMTKGEARYVRRRVTHQRQHDLNTADLRQQGGDGRRQARPPRNRLLFVGLAIRTKGNEFAHVKDGRMFQHRLARRPWKPRKLKRHIGRHERVAAQGGSELKLDHRRRVGHQCRKGLIDLGTLGRAQFGAHIGAGQSRNRLHSRILRSGTRPIQKLPHDHRALPARFITTAIVPRSNLRKR